MTFEEAVAKTGWNAESQVQVLLEYIEMLKLLEGINMPVTFESYLSDRVKEEEGHE